MSMSLAIEASESDAPTWAKRGLVTLLKPLWLILLLQAAASTLLLHNTAFEDEALYIHAGTQLLRSLTGGPPPPADYATFFSGYPYFYPLLAGVLNQFGGLETVRIFSLACMLVTTACVYVVTRQLYTQASAYAAALLFACAGPTLFLSQLATFDTLSLMLLALATLVAFQVSAARNPAGAAVVALLLVLAVAAKYAALLFVPFVIALMAVRTLEQRGWRRALSLVVLALATLAVIAVGLYFVTPHDVLAGLSVTTTSRIALIRTPDSYLLTIIWSLGGLVWVLSLIGLAFSPKRLRLVGLVLFVASLAAPAYHLYTGESVSLHKHIDFGLFFAVPLAGYMVSELITSFVPRIQARVVLLLLLFAIAFVMGAQNALWWYHGWPDTTHLISTARTQLWGGNGRYLCGDYEILEYYLDGVTTDQQYTGPYTFRYTDAHGNHLTGEAAYKAAINDGYFDVIELNFPHGALSNALSPVVEAQSQYHLVAKLTYSDSYGTGYYLIWGKS